MSPAAALPAVAATYDGMHHDPATMATSEPPAISSPEGTMRVRELGGRRFDFDEKEQ